MAGKSGTWPILGICSSTPIRPSRQFFVLFASIDSIDVDDHATKQAAVDYLHCHPYTARPYTENRFIGHAMTETEIAALEAVASGMFRGHMALYLMV
jgi:hypothetical protein